MISTSAIDHAAPLANRKPFYGWVCVAIASAAMVATLPGRTIGLGAITEPLLADLRLSHADLATINLAATAIGALFSLGVGRLVDRIGARAVCTAVAALLAMTVICSAHGRSYWELAVATTLTRGLGQCALSVVSIAVVGKWFVRRIGVAMGVYTLLLSIGFVIAVPSLEYAAHRLGWRAAWGGMGWIILAAFTPLAALLLRSTPESVGLRPDGANDLTGTTSGLSENVIASPREIDFTLGQALRTGTFWSLASCGLLFALFFNGFVLFRESILTERGLDASVAMSAAAVLTFTGLVANGVAGWASQRYGMGRTAGASMLLMAIAAATLSAVHTPAQAMTCAALIGFSGGGIAVVFFACWSHHFGRRHVGRIQGAAQIMTVAGSALGPLSLAWSRSHFQTYTPAFAAAAVMLAGSGIWAWLAPQCRRASEGGECAPLSS